MLVRIIIHHGDCIVMHIDSGVCKNIHNMKFQGFNLHTSFCAVGIYPNKQEHTPATNEPHMNRNFGPVEGI